MPRGSVLMGWLLRVRYGVERAGTMDELGTPHGPDQGEHLADDEVVGDEATAGLPHVRAGVRGVAAVVAHHPQIALGDRLVELGERGRGVLGQVRLLVQRVAV